MQTFFKSGHNFQEVNFFPLQQNQMNNDSTKTPYVPKLHTDMSDWKKVMWFNEHVTKQYPHLDGTFPDMTTLEYTRKAISHVNSVLEEERKKYEKRVEKREKAKELEKETQKAKEEAHVKEMKKKYGLGWEFDVEDTSEDCRTAWRLREERERKDEIEYYEQLDELMDMQKKFRAIEEKKDHEELFFDVCMDLVTKGLSPVEKEKYISQKKQVQFQREVEEMFEDDLTLEAESDAWVQSFEKRERQKEEKKKRIASYEAK
jgi:hypothetical protein